MKLIVTSHTVNSSKAKCLAQIMNNIDGFDIRACSIEDEDFATMMEGIENRSHPVIYFIIKTFQKPEMFISLTKQKNLRNKCLIVNISMKNSFRYNFSIVDRFSN